MNKKVKFATNTFFDSKAITVKSLDYDEKIRLWFQPYELAETRLKASIMRYFKPKGVSLSYFYLNN